MQSSRHQKPGISNHMIAVIDYRAGNLTSVRLALESLQVDSVITDDPACILESERVIFPGVGAAGEAMKVLLAEGLDEAIRAYFRSGRPGSPVPPACTF